MKNLIKLLIISILGFINISYALDFNEAILKNTVHITEGKNIKHPNDPVPISKGTGFVVKLNRNYIITAKHVLRDIKSNELIVEKQGDQYIQQTLVPIKIGTKNLWYEHPIEDIALIPTDINATISQDDLDLNSQAPLGSFALSVGFPKGTYQARFRGGIISFNNLQDKLEELFFDATITSGESGSPVFIPQIKKIIGIVSGVEEDLKIGLVVPIHFIKEISIE